jgi:mannose/cellobiose epimerase-like protein (N-acyl-D-glucosamine 2-epimerase family)
VQFLWLQAREVWMFSKLFNEVETADAATKQTWLDMAKYFPSLPGPPSG